MALEFSIEIDDKGTPKLKKFQKEVKKTGSVAESASAAISKTATAATAIGVAAAGAIVGVTAFANSITHNVRELQTLSNLVGSTPQEFQKLSEGSKRVGIEQDKLADIFKDTNDKIGDFLQTGGGAAADFFENIAPQIGVTAKEFANLSGPQALQKYYNSLEKANLTQSEMTFYMEAIASDATNLIPLLKENGKGFKEYGDQAERAGAIISEDLIASTKNYEAALFDLETTGKGILNELATDLLPVLAEGANNLAKAFEVAGPQIVKIVEKMLPGLLKITNFIADAVEGAGLLAEAWDSMKDPKISVVTADIENQAKAIARERVGLKLTTDQLAAKNKLQKKIFSQGRELGLQNVEIQREQSIALIKQFNEMKKIQNLDEWTIKKLDEKIEAERQNVVAINQKIKAEKEASKAAAKAEADKEKASKAEKTRTQEEAKRRRDAIAQAKKDREQAAKLAAAEAIKQREIESAMFEAAREEYEQQQEKKKQDAKEFADKQKEVQKDLSNFFKSDFELREQEIKDEYELRVKYIGLTAEVEKARMMELAELRAEQAQQQRDQLASQFENIGQITSNVSSTLANITQAEQNQINQDFDNRKRKVEELYQAQLKGAEGNAAKTEAIQRTRDEKLRQLDLKRERDLQASAKRTAAARKRAAQLEAVVNTAAAVTKALPNIPLSIAVGLQGASQIALIESQQFFKGGMTDEGQQMISVGENGREFVVSAGGTRQAGEAALEDINNGRLEDAANRLLSQSGSSRGGMTININGGVVDEQFMENSLIPKLKEFERRI